MAFESSMEQKKAAAVTRRQIFTPSMEMPEKLPIDQLMDVHDIGVIGEGYDKIRCRRTDISNHNPAYH